MQSTIGTSTAGEAETYTVMQQCGSIVALEKQTGSQVALAPARN